MNLNIILFVCIIKLSVVISEDCLCYVGYAKDTGEVYLQEQICGSSPVAPVPLTTKSSITTKPLSTPTAPMLTKEPVPTTTPSTNGTGNANSTTPTTTPITNVTTTKMPTTTPSTKPTSKVMPTKSRKRRDAEIQKYPACCQMSIVQASTKLKFNASVGWTAYFSCYNSSSENAMLCNETKCNDLQFMSLHTQWKLPKNCESPVDYVYMPQKTSGYMLSSSVENMSIISACNQYSYDNCSTLNLTESPCPQEGLCCCQLPIGQCKASPTPTPRVSAMPRGNNPTKTSQNAKKNSFDWKIVGYIATGVVFGIFITIVLKFIYGKKKSNGLRIPDYKYSRLRADYVADDQELL